MGAHSRIGASSAKRWLNCPGSVRLSNGLPNLSSEYAKEGTAAHSLAEICLRTGQLPSELMGHYIDKEGGISKIPSTIDLDTGEISSDEIEVTEDMAKAVQVYLDVINQLKSKFPSAKFEFEKRFSLGFINKDMFGTCDFVLYEDFGTLYVTDYKHGAGVFVEVANNPQLIYYAIGAAWDTERQCFHDFENVELTIVQPRAYGGQFRKHLLPISELKRWAKIFEEGVEETKKPNAKLESGEWCQFCPAKSYCPLLCEKAMEVAKQTFLPPEILNNAQIENIINRQKEIESFLAKVKEMTLFRLKNGEQIGDLKLVRGKGKRVWTDEVLTEDFFSIKAGKDAYQVKLKSPAQMEKIEGVKKSEVSEFVTHELGGITVAPGFDSRPPILPAELDFK